MPQSPQPNRLIHQHSPYLLQHAHNPVAWQPWDRAALAEARRRDCPIFLSVGYSSCYWCHVMERESFEDQAVAEALNRHFVSIKVDRELRPDIDQLYMLAVQLITRQTGGWPMNVFLTPQLKPFYGGTYFPPRDTAQMPGLLSVLEAVTRAWQDRRSEIEQSAQEVLSALRHYAVPEPPSAQAAIRLDQAALDTLLGRSVADYDRRHGGFGDAPKFPRQTLLELLLHYTASGSGRAATDAVGKMLAHTLEAMARGGIRDQLGGAFHRYSTDAQWLVPHFEIMLYDNAMLAWVYAEASRQLNSPALAEVARGICDFVLSDMTSPDGGFYSSCDAEVSGREGASYLWTMNQVRAVISPAEAELVGRVYGLDRGPNFTDPHHHGAEPANVLYLPQPLDAVAAELGLSEAELSQRLAPLRQRLLEARRQRPQPRLDKKILTSWNCLMVRGLARCGAVLGEDRYIQAAVRSADLILQTHYSPGGSLLRQRPPVTAPAPQAAPAQVEVEVEVEDLPGSLEDYAALALALVELSDATRETRWLESAREILQQIEARFGDSSAPAPGAYYQSPADDDSIIVRQQSLADTPLPSGNAMAALALLQTGSAPRARELLLALWPAVDQQAESASALVQALLLYVHAHGILKSSD